jgi:hypothetical protein
MRPATTTAVALFLAFLGVVFARPGRAADLFDYPISPGAPSGVGPATLFAPTAANPAFGTVGHGVGLRLPPARNGLVPALALRYVSSPHRSSLGLGWEIPLVHVRHSLRHGPPRNLNVGLSPNTHRLEYQLGGDSGELVRVGTYGDALLFRPKSDRSFAKFLFNTSTRTFTIQTQDGTVYTLGAVDDHAITVSNRAIAAWYVKTVRDTQCNEICYEYREGQTTCDPNDRTFGPIRLIEYNRRSSAPGCSGAQARQINRVRFHWSTPNGLEPPLPGSDISARGWAAGNVVSFRKGWEQRFDAHQLDSIEISGSDETGKVGTLHYRLSHRRLGPTSTAVSRVQVDLGNGKTLPALDFQYRPEPTSFGGVVQMPDPAVGTGAAAGPPSSQLDHGTEQYALEETAYLHSVACGPPVCPVMTSSVRQSLARLVDWDGDGDLDQLVVRNSSNYPDLGAAARWFVRINQHGRLGPLVRLTGPQTGGALDIDLRLFGKSTVGTQRVLDVNGDRRPDVLYIGGIPVALRAALALPDGSGWAPPRLWAPGSVSLSTVIATAEGAIQTADTLDYNGDGYPDRLERNKNHPRYMHVYLGRADGMSSSPLDDGSGKGVLFRACEGNEACIRRWVTRDSVSTLVNDLRDVNGDGLPDFLAASEATGRITVSYGTGVRTISGTRVSSGFVGAYDLGPGRILRTEGAADTETLADLNGDGFVDRISGPHRNTDCDGHR